VRVFKTKWFSRFASKENIDDAKLVETVQSIESGLVDADLGMTEKQMEKAIEGGVLIEVKYVQKIQE